MLKFYVYAYLRSVTSSTGIAGSPYYIGKGSGNRAIKQHTNIKTPDNRRDIVYIECNLTNVGALAIERRLIRWYGRVDNNTGILRNLTDGGEGAIGKKTSEHTKNLLRQHFTGRPRKKSTYIKTEIWHNTNWAFEKTENMKKHQSKISTGSGNGNAKLNELDVINIRKLIHSESKSNIELAILYNVSTQTISHIRNYRSWKHI